MNNYLVSARYGFVWPDFPTVQSPAYSNITVGSSFLPPPWLPQNEQHLMHAGIVVVTFCDGHTDSLSDNWLRDARRTTAPSFRNGLFDGVRQRRPQVAGWPILGLETR